MESEPYEAIKKLLAKHVAKWKGVKSQEDGPGYVMARIEEFVDDPDVAQQFLDSEN